MLLGLSVPIYILEMKPVTLWGLLQASGKLAHDGHLGQLGPPHGSLCGRGREAPVVGGGRGESDGGGAGTCKAHARG